MCVCWKGPRPVWMRIKAEKKSGSLTCGLAAIAALASIQSKGVVTSQGRRSSGVPSERVNDGHLPPGTGLAGARLQSER